MLSLLTWTMAFPSLAPCDRELVVPTSFMYKPSIHSLNEDVYFAGKQCGGRYTPGETLSMVTDHTVGQWIIDISGGARFTSSSPRCNRKRVINTASAIVATDADSQIITLTMGRTWSSGLPVQISNPCTLYPPGVSPLPSPPPVMSPPLPPFAPGARAACACNSTSALDALDFHVELLFVSFGESNSSIASVLPGASSTLRVVGRARRQPARRNGPNAQFYLFGSFVRLCLGSSADSFDFDEQRPFVAPSAPGRYALSWSWSSHRTCMPDGVSNQTDSEAVATLVVAPPPGTIGGTAGGTGSVDDHDDHDAPAACVPSYGGGQSLPCTSGVCAISLPAHFAPRQGFGRAPVWRTLSFGLLVIALAALALLPLSRSGPLSGPLLALAQLRQEDRRLHTALVALWLLELGASATLAVALTYECDECNGAAAGDPFKGNSRCMLRVYAGIVAGLAALLGGLLTARAARLVLSGEVRVQRPRRAGATARAPPWEPQLAASSISSSRSGTAAGGAASAAIGKPIAVGVPVVGRADVVRPTQSPRSGQNAADVNNWA
jgi:hypothetical protein